MLGNYLLTAFRNLLKRRTISLINILGLSVGIACCLLIFLWFQFEFGYDDFHENLEDLYVACTEVVYGTQSFRGIQSPPALCPALVDEYPQVVRATRVIPRSDGILSYKDKQFKEVIRSVDPDFLRMFTFRFLRGDPATALDDPHSIVLTESMARKYFGDEDPLGRILQLDYTWDMRVTGVAEDVPGNSTFHFDFLAPLEWIQWRELGRQGMFETWYNYMFYTYVQLRPGSDWRSLSESIEGRIQRADPESKDTCFLFPFRDMRLYSVSGEGEYIDLLRMFAIVAGLVLLIACINFMNTATARGGDRAREIGVRKAVGAQRRELVGQFYFEALLQSFVALVIAFVIAEQFLPIFRELTGADVGIDYAGDPRLLLGGVLIALITGLVAGSYPALVLSSFRPAVVLHGALAAGSKGTWLRRILVVVQFATAVVLIICTLTIHSQFSFMREKDVGFERGNLVRIVIDHEIRENFGTLKTRFLEHPNVANVTMATHSPSGIYWNGSGWDWEGRDPNVDPSVTYMGVGLDWPPAMGIEMLAGRFYGPEHVGTDRREAVINETFAEYLGEGSAVGKWITNSWQESPLTVIGVVRDFHFKPLYEPIGPLVIFHEPEFPFWYAFVRIRDEQVEETLAFLDEAYHDIRPGRMFEYNFVEEEFEGMYGFLESLGEIFRVFAVVAVILSCVGLFGLATFMTEQRSKEIGIRKVLGASVTGIVMLLTKEFVRWVLVANLIGWPVAYWLMGRWLQGLSYRVDLGPDLFALPGLFSLAAAMIAVGYQALRAALANPVDAIRYE